MVAPVAVPDLYRRHRRQEAAHLHLCGCAMPPMCPAPQTRANTKVRAAIATKHGLSTTPCALIRLAWSSRCPASEGVLMNLPEPIAIVGMACRFAGNVDSLQKFWQLLLAGDDTVGDLPAGRWDWYGSQSHKHGKALRNVTRRGAFLDDIQGFDADFFEITPREAELMDPQQRITLELAWEALEHAGISPHRIAGTDTGVFMGVGADDYGRRLLEDLPGIEAWSGIGGAYCAVANRISHLLDLRGPSMAVDTACSSSLVAIHLATQALQAGQCPLAIVGGVLVMAAPGLSMVLDAAGATSPDGRSKSFDAAADGYGRGEGAGVVVLKRLRDAHHDGDRVLAVIRGSAVHQDGRTNGIMAPNGKAQAHLMRRTYETAGVDPATVAYVEAHGTGTRAGDPLEVAAMSEVFGAARPADRPCLIGSAKPNIGHLEAGAGIAGVIKAVLALDHALIPPSIIDTPTPVVSWDTCGLKVVDRPTPWLNTDGPRRAGVSAYGYGGTLAHVILEQAPDPDTAQQRNDGVTRPPESGLLAYPLSGASVSAVQGLAGRLADHLETATDDLLDVAYTLSRRRAHLPHRRVVVAADRPQLVSRLRDLAELGTSAVEGRVLPGAGQGLVWVFSGHGSQWIGMGAGLLDHDAAFTAVIDRLEPLFAEEMGVSLRAAIHATLAQPVDIAQPMIFAMQTALSAFWRARGVRPDAVIGHSVGEIAAAVAADVLTLEQGARLVCRRSLLLRRVIGRGAMAMVNLPADDVDRRLQDRGDDVTAAVAASTKSTVISGGVDAVRTLLQQWRAEGLLVREVDSNVAFHGPQMDPLLADLSAAAADLEPAAPTTVLYSTAMEDPRSTIRRDGAYWAANLRGRVMFSQAVTAAVKDGYRLFLEIASHPVVEHSINEVLEDLGIDDTCVTHSTRRRRPEEAALLDSLALLYCHGARIDWSQPHPAGRLVDLPTTVWQHRRYWAAEPAPVSGVAQTHDPLSHTLLGGRIAVHASTPAHVWTTHLELDSRPYPGGHPVRDVEIVPAAVLLNTFLAAASQTVGWSDLVDVTLRTPVSLTNPREVQVVLQDRTVRLSTRLASSKEDESEWLTHTTASVAPVVQHEPEQSAPANAAGAAETAPLPSDHVVRRLAELGVAAMGFPWRLLQLHGGPRSIAATVDAGGAAFHGTWASVLDAAFSVASVSFTGPPVLRMPAHIDHVRLTSVPPAQAHVRAVVTGEDTVDIDISTVDGEVLGRISGLRYGVFDRAESATVNPRTLVHEVGWTPVEHPAPAAGSLRITVVGPASDLRTRLHTELSRAHVQHRVVADATELRADDLVSGHTVLVVPDPKHSLGTAAAATRGTWLLTRTAQRLTRNRNVKPARLWCMTEGVKESTATAALVYAPLWGLGRIIGGEHPEVWGGVIDVDGTDLSPVVDIIATMRWEDVIAIRDGALAVPRLHELRGEPVRPPVACRSEGTYLITGGLGALGLRVAHWLAGRGARRIVLVGRHGLPARDTWDAVEHEPLRAQVDAVRSLERAGVTVVTVALDITDPRQTAERLSPDALGLPPICGVVHAAGVVANGILETVDETAVHDVMRPKVDGALVLHELFPAGSLDFFVLFSSSGQMLGLPGQSTYAAANAFLDALAVHRHSQGDSATISIGWTSWRGLGMSTSSAAIDVELQARGTADISADEAFAAWEVAERHDLPYVAVLRTLAPDQSNRRLPVLSELSLAASVPAESAESTEPWAQLTGKELYDHIAEVIRTSVAEETGLNAGELDARRPLLEMGLDSVMTVRIRGALERKLQIPLPATLFWDRPTIDAVATLMVEVISGDVWPC
ncbi:type I polyketide synthase [Dactylosporangium sp. NPDC049525]|uniref:type I polyketide synthase n=1 Tax=Dactylosporangium sp. NPDC049525 TaxID=3154730 RepID=UPI00343F7182